MHELGLLQGVVAAVETQAQSLGATRVSSVTLRVGTRSGAVPEALMGAWGVAIGHTILADAELKLEVVEAAVWCPACQAEQIIDEFYAWTCPVCSTPTAALVRGREFEVTSAEVYVPADD